MLELALIGVGRWGKNIKQTLEEMRGVEVISFNTSPPAPLLIKERGVSGILIATPGSTHADIALPYLKQGLPVFIEKPMATSLKDAGRLASAAKKNGANVFVGHIHLYNPAYLKLKSLLPRIGKVQHIHFEGLAPGPVRGDMSVLWDWGPHAVSLMMDLLNKSPKEVFGSGETAKDNLQHTVFAKLEFAGGIAGSVHISWLWPEKRVKLTVVGERGGLILDESAVNKIALLRDGKVHFPRYSRAMPLAEELKAFVQMVRTKKSPKTDIENGLEVVRVLAAIDKSIKLDGRRVRC